MWRRFLELLETTEGEMFCLMIVIWLTYGSLLFWMHP